nr:pseudouridine-5'-phosphate glycosidase [Kallotenue papyrolyticum]
MIPELRFDPAVRAALEAGRAVVALESTVIAHGLPHPHNLELAREMEALVRAGGATPATIGVVAGQPTIGLDAATLARFATGAEVRKLSRRDLGVAIAAGQHGATTVAATMALAQLAGIEVFATGGIGGVHRGARDSWDVSADLTELSRTPVLVVCAGAKSILDLPATLEMLETLGVPVVGYGTETFPAFYSVSSGLRLSARVDSPDEAAAVWRAHRRYGGGSGMLLVVPPPAESALPQAEVAMLIDAALAEAAQRGIQGAQVTPFLLATIAERSGGRSLTANIALLKNNARVAAAVAVALRAGA